MPTIEEITLTPKQLGALINRYEWLRRELAANGRLYVSHSWHEQQLRREMEASRDAGARDRLRQHWETRLGCMQHISGCDDEIRRQCAEIISQLGDYAPLLRLERMRFNEYGERTDNLI